MVKRIISALLLIPAILVITYYSNNIYHILILISQIIMLFEYFKTLNIQKDIFSFTISLTIFAAVLLHSTSRLNTATLFLWAVAVLILVILWNLFRYEPSVFFRNCSYIFFGLIYISFFGFMHYIKEFPYGYKYIYFLLFITWAGDTGAYFIGSLIGKKKIFPVLSPNKTLEGTIGCLFFSIITGSICRLIFLNNLSLMETGILSGLLGITAIAGDLISSGLKRAVRVKDFSNLIPGHGGIFDRVDSLLFNNLFLFFYLFFRIN